MIKVYYNRLKNDNIEMTQDMLTDILSYTKRQDKYIKQLKEEYMILQNASNEVEEELQERINKVLEYIDKCKTLALVDKVNILSVGVIEHTLKGDDIEDEN